MELIALALTWVTSNLALIFQVIGIFALIATLTPNKADDKIVQWILDLVNFFAANIGKAKNTPNE